VGLSLAHVLVLPPWEGFDETAHYSYISVLADEGRIPDFRATPLDATIEHERQWLPRPYSGVPPFERNGGLTYADFFNRIDAAARQAALRRWWKPPPEPVRYLPGTEPNWQGQHPPLFYVLLAGPYRLTRSCSPAIRLLVLRLCATAMACGSLVFWWKAMRWLDVPPASPPRQDGAPTPTLLVPASTTGGEAARRLLFWAGATVLWLPSCWFDLARLGNDSLTALLVSATCYYLLRACYPQRNRRGSHKRPCHGSGWDFFLLGISLGLGLLTKAFFFPILLGVWTCLVCRHPRQGGEKSRWWRLVLAVALPLVIAAPWWLSFWMRYGTFIGSAELYELRMTAEAKGAMLGGLAFMGEMLRAVAAFMATFLWCGTWSWLKRPLWEYALLAPFMLLAMRGLIRELAGTSKPWLSLAKPQPFSPTKGDGLKVKGTQPAYLSTQQLTVAAAIILGFLLVGFLFHMYGRVYWTARGAGTGGYYLFAAWPLVGLLLAGVWKPLNQSHPAVNENAQTTSAKWSLVPAALLVLSVAFAFVFEASGLWRCLQLYSGLLEKVGDCATGVGGGWPTPPRLALAYTRLGQFAWPGWAAACYFLSATARIVLLIAILRCHLPVRPSG
jgi:hypothetical protein